MKKVLSIVAVLLMAVAVNAQVLLDEDFSGGIPSTWTMFTDGHSAHNASQTAAWSVSYDCGNPAPGVVSASWFEPAGTADRWLITDSIQIPTTGYVFCIEAACYEAAYPDGFMVKVSTTDRESRASFTETIISVSACTDVFTEYRGSLDAFAGQTIYIAVIQNSNDMNFLIADNFKVMVPPINEIALTALDMPDFVALGSSINVSGTVRSTGVAPLTSYDVIYTVNDGAPVTYTVNNINIARGSTHNFTHNVPFTPEAAGTYSISVTIANPNGEEDPSFDDNSLVNDVVVYDPSTTVSRTNILEQFTGAACGYCPAGAERISQAVSGRNVIWVTHHAGFGTDGLSNASSSQYTFFYNNGPNTFAPAMMVNRYHGDATAPGPVVSVYPTNEIASYLDELGNVPCFLNLDMSGLNFDANTRVLSGNVTGHFTSNVYNSNTRLTLFLIEDSIDMDQADYYNGLEANNYYVPYTHMHTCRGTLTNAWGDAITPDANGDFTYNVNYTLPANHKAWRCRVAGIVADYYSGDANSCTVYQAASTENFNAPYVGISEANEVSLRAYPNPATDYITVEAGAVINEIVLINSIGQTVQTLNNVNSEYAVLNTQNLATGVYMLSIRTNNGLATQRISVVR